MTPTDEFTATGIAEVICKAQGLVLGENAVLHNRLKYIAKREILNHSRTIDGRGTLAFGKLEIYRAAVFVELIGLAMDVRALVAVTEAAAKNARNFSVTSQKVQGGYLSRGGLADAVNGVAAEEPWFLKVWRVNPGRNAPESIAAAFVPATVEDRQLWGDEKYNAKLGRQPSRAHVTVDLTALFRPLVELVGAV